MIDAGEIALLSDSEQNGTVVQITVTTCLYQCCGRGWKPREGYEQRYRGRVAGLVVPDGTFKLLAAGIGTLSYIVQVMSWADVELVEALSG